MEIIDSHVHIYPAKIAQKATIAIGEFYNIKMAMPEGTTDKLIEEGEKAGITKYLVHSVATTPHQVHSINSFILSELQKHKEFIGFMTLHQDLSEEEIYNEILWCLSKGFKGIKLHPDFQKFNIDDANVEKIYRSVLKINKDFPILLHMGDDRYTYSKPIRLCNIAKKYPTLTFIGAHFGGYKCWNEVDCYKGLDNIYFDTSSTLPFITCENAEQLIKQFGYKKFFFGTDFPMWNANEELKRFNKLKLTEEEKQAILSQNIKKLLNL